MDEGQKHLLAASLERVKRQVDPGQLQTFEFCHHEKWPVQKIAGTLGVGLGLHYLAKRPSGRLL